MKEKNNNEVIGIIAAIFTTSAWLPQAIKVWWLRPAPAEGVSITMYIVISIGIVLWAIYGFRKKDRPLIMANLISLFLSCLVLLYKIIYG